MHTIELKLGIIHSNMVNILHLAPKKISHLLGF